MALTVVVEQSRVEKSGLPRDRNRCKKSHSWSPNIGPAQSGFHWPQLLVPPALVDIICQLGFHQSVELPFAHAPA